MRHLYLVKDGDTMARAQRKLADELVEATAELRRQRDEAETKAERDAYQKALMLMGSAALKASCPETFGT